MPKGDSQEPASTLPAIPPEESLPPLPSGVTIQVNTQAAPKAKRNRPLPPPPVADLPEPTRFESFMDRLKASEGLGEGRTELEMRLHRQDKTDGSERWAFTGVVIRYTADDIASGTDPDLEALALDHAMKAGRFGVYRWTLRGWENGQLLVDTTKNLTLDPPFDFVPPPLKAQPAAPPEPLKSAKEEALDLLGLAEKLSGMGKHSPDPSFVENVRAAARKEGYDAGVLAGKLEAAETWRQRMEDKVADAKKEGLEQGRKEGRWESKDEFQAKISELEKEQIQPASIVGEVVSSLGGPAALQGIVGALFAPKPQAPPAPLPPPVAYEDREPLPPPPAPVGPPEPSRAAHHEAMESIEVLLDLLHSVHEEAPEPQVKAVIDAFEAFKQEGLVEGPLGAWWVRWTTSAKAEVEKLTAQIEAQLDGHDAKEPGGKMQADQLKAMLKTRLEAGADPEAIIQEIEPLAKPEDLETWKALIRANPRALVYSFLGIPETLQARANVVLDQFTA